jgi:uncharacterized membrane protein
MFDISHLHPLTVHFPVALIITGFFIEVLSLFFNKREPCLSKAGFYLMLLGTLGAVAAFLTGEFFTEELKGKAGEVEELHEVFAKICMYTMVAASVLRIFLMIRKKDNTGWKWAVFSLYFIGTVFVGIAGLYGGTLVYNYIIGGL